MSDSQPARSAHDTWYWRRAITIALGIDLVFIGILSFVPGSLGIGSYNPCSGGVAVKGETCGEVTTIGLGAWILIILGVIVIGFLVYKLIRAFLAERAATAAAG